MGDRGQIKVLGSQGEAVYLYTHWRGSDLPRIVREALIRGTDRWGDSEYLARILFCTMVPKDEWADSTGFGIGLEEHGDLNHLLITVDCRSRTVLTGYNREESFGEYTGLE